MATRVERPEREARAQESATRWTQLEGELRMICRSLANPQGWTPEAVTTFVRLPGDAEYQQAIGALCRRLGLEYRLETTVRRDGDDWGVRFARPGEGRKAAARTVPASIPFGRGMRAAIARACATARRLTGLGARPPEDAV
jgi:hypothetical protein